MNGPRKIHAIKKTKENRTFIILSNPKYFIGSKIEGSEKRTPINNNVARYLKGKSFNLPKLFMI